MQTCSQPCSPALHSSMSTETENDDLTLIARLFKLSMLFLPFSLFVNSHALYCKKETYIKQTFIWYM